MREYSKSYDQSQLSAIGESTITYQVYAFPLSNATDLKITPTDGILQILKADPMDMMVGKQMVLYPTPTNGLVTAKFKLYEKTEVKLAVYDLGGRLVFEILEGTYPIGVYEQTFDLGTLNPGEYIAILKTGKNKITDRTVKVN